MLGTLGMGMAELSDQDDETAAINNHPTSDGGKNIQLSPKVQGRNNRSL